MATKTPPPRGSSRGELPLPLAIGLGAVAVITPLVFVLAVLGGGSDAGDPVSDDPAPITTTEDTAGDAASSATEDTGEPHQEESDAASAPAAR